MTIPMMPVQDKRLHSRSTQGFSLLELSIVLGIIAFLTGSGLVIGQSTMESAEVAATNSRMIAIETALLAYRRSNNRLPCPGDATLTPGDANYGYEAANPGSCTGGAPAANYNVTVSTSKIVEGTIPVRSLSLPDEFIYDGWGRKFAYAAWAPLTGINAFQDYGITPNCGLIKVYNAAGIIGIPRTVVGDYALISYGKNGHGGYNASGARVGDHSVNVDEQINCHCDDALTNTGFIGTYVSKEATQDPNNTHDNFDDIVHFKERWQLQSYSDEYNPGGKYTCPLSPAGFRTDGDIANSRVGWSIAVGDVNGDGIPDLIIGAPYDTVSGTPGSVYVVFGTIFGFPNPLPLSSLDGINGFVMNSADANDGAGSSVAVGDVNEDGVADIIIGAPNHASDKGRVYIVFGHTGNWSPTLDLSTLDGTTGAYIDGIAAGDKAGYAVAVADLNGDFVSDVVIGAPYVTNGANSQAGATYVVYGHMGAWAATSDLTSFTGFTIAGDTGGAKSGYSLAVGDINGDGIPDLLIGAPGYASGIGAVYTFYGKHGGLGNIGASLVNGRNGYRVQGINTGDAYGSSVAVGNINADHMGDMIIGAPGYNGNKGAVYVIFGQTSRRSADYSMLNLNGNNGFRIDGVAVGDKIGSSVAAGDLNGDGLADIMIGAPEASPGGNSHAGSTYVLFGQASGWTSTFALSSLNGTNGFRLDGAAAGDKAGFALSSSDINGDTKADLLIGAYNRTAGAHAGAGGVYTFFGQRQSSAWANPYALSGM